MPELRDTRKKVQLGLGALVLLDIALMAVLFSPLVGSPRTRQEQLSTLWRELQTKTREVEPLRRMDIVAARKQIDQFYSDRLPAQDSVISENLGKLASQSGVKIGQVRYVRKDPESVGLRPVFVEADLTGDYLQLVKFINALERDHTFFIVDSVDLGGEQGGVVKLQMKLETYLRTGT